MNKQYNFERDVKFLTGRGALRNATIIMSNMGCRKVLLICDEESNSSGKYKKVLRSQFYIVAFPASDSHTNLSVVGRGDEQLHKTEHAGRQDNRTRYSFCAYQRSCARSLSLRQVKGKRDSILWTLHVGYGYHFAFAKRRRQHHGQGLCAKCYNVAHRQF